MFVNMMDSKPGTSARILIAFNCLQRNIYEVAVLIFKERQMIIHTGNLHISAWLSEIS